MFGVAPNGSSHSCDLGLTGWPVRAAFGGFVFLGLSLPVSVGSSPATRVVVPYQAGAGNIAGSVQLNERSVIDVPSKGARPRRGCTSAGHPLSVETELRDCLVQLWFNSRTNASALSAIRTMTQQTYRSWCVRRGCRRRGHRGSASRARSRSLRCQLFLLLPRFGRHPCP
jgi:hypothetical protein